MRTLAMWMLCLGGVLASAYAEEAPAVRLQGLDLGTHWYGPAVTTDQLAGQIVLYVMWGSTTGSKQVTPHLIALAERLEGRPFHLVASHCEDEPGQAEVIAYATANGLSPHAPNLTIVKNGRHPRIEPPGGDLPKYPYYVLFDQDGRVLHQALGGTYFGGDGLAFVERTEAAVAAADEIPVGAEPYAHHGALARKLAAGKGIGPALRKVVELLAEEGEDAGRAELLRLQEAVVRYRDRSLRHALALEGSRPSEILKRLRALAAELKGTSLVEPVDAALTRMASSQDLKDAIAIEKKYRSIRKGFDRVKESKRSDELIERTTGKLEALLEGHDDLPIADTVRAYLRSIR